LSVRATTGAQGTGQHHRKSRRGNLVHVLDESELRGGEAVDMQHDWKVIFHSQQAHATLAIAVVPRLQIGFA
jgi:hypothetical protein